MAPALYKLKGKVQHYQWGGYQFLPELLHLANADRKPCAEYWLGAHVNAPAEVEENGGIPLDRFIEQHPEALGNEVKQRFGRLPYLLKVLDVKDMLSIQVHPSKEAAAKEYAIENEKGIPLNAPNRNYKDDNHKPELMVALSEFWLLHGFKSEQDILATMRDIPEFNFLFALLEEGGLQHAYKKIMEEDQDRINRRLQPLLDRIIPQYKHGKLKKTDPHYWAARAALTFNEVELTDRGIFSVYLLNLVQLQPGEAIFQDAGVLHAYLEGQNMEIMANSDNVLRGGLTPKHIDVQELMKHVNFTSITPKLIHGQLRGTKEEVFVSPAPDFELSKFRLGAGEQVTVSCNTTDIFFALEGSAEMKEGPANTITINKGEAAVATAGAELTIRMLADGEIYRASVPVI